MKGQFVVVTTDSKNRGVFAGILTSGGLQDGFVTLKNAQMCVYWSKETRGVLGLASHGPAKGSRITRPTPETTVNFVTSISIATDDARTSWEACPWD